MNTAHAGVRASITALLKAARVADGRVYDRRTRAISIDTPHAVVVRLERSASELGAVIGASTDWKTLICIECYGRMVGDAPDDASDEIVAHVFETLAASPTLGGAAMGVEPMPGDTLGWDYDELDERLACTTARFVVSHRTKGRTLSA